MACHAVTTRKTIATFFTAIALTCILRMFVSCRRIPQYCCSRPVTPPDFLAWIAIYDARIGLARTEELQQDRNQGGTGNVVVLTGQESAMRVRKGVCHSRDRIAELLRALVSADYQRGDGDRRTSLVQHGPVAENRQVVRCCMNDQLVPFPRVWHQERHREHKRTRCTVDVGHEEPHRTGKVAGRNQ